MEKLCLILDHYIQNHGTLPSEKYVRNYGHKIPDLYNACRDIAKQHKIGFHFRYKMHYDIHHTDFGTVHDYQLPTPLTTHEYVLEITHLRSTALHTYADARLTFDSSVPDDRRNEIAYAYLNGLIAPLGRLDVAAGEGEEIALPRSLRWDKDGLTAWIEIEGNPRESYPEKVVYYPCWDILDYDWEGDKPSLSEDNALIIEWKSIP